MEMSHGSRNRKIVLDVDEAKAFWSIVEEAWKIVKRHEVTEDERGESAAEGAGGVA